MCPLKIKLFTHKMKNRIFVNDNCKLSEFQIGTPWRTAQPLIQITEHIAERGNIFCLI